MSFDLNRILELAGLRPQDTRVDEGANEPDWITRIFSLPDGARADIEIDGAELSVAMLGLNLPDAERPVGLRGLETPAHLRGRGIGSRIYRELVKAADTYGRPLELDAYPYEARKTNPDGKATPEQVKALVNHLGGFGFRPLAAEPNFNRPVAMVYRPKVAAGDSPRPDLRDRAVVAEDLSPAAADTSAIVDLRDPSVTKPDAPTCIALTKSGGAIIYIWGDGNRLDWREVLELVDRHNDPAYGDGHLDLQRYKRGYAIDRGRETGQWTGDRNRYSADIIALAQALQARGLTDARTPIFIGNPGRGEADMERVGTVGSILARAEAPTTRLVLYHGTSSVRLPMILRDGLRALDLDDRVWNKGGLDKMRPEHRETSVYLTASPAQAKYYAEKAVKIDRKRMGPSSVYNAKARVRRAQEAVRSLQAQLDHLTSLSPEALQSLQDHENRYGYRRRDFRIEMKAIPEQIARLRAEIAADEKVASIDHDGPIRPVILEVTLGAADMRKLMADDDHLALHPETDPTDWRASLSAFGQVAYQGRIPASRLRIAK